MRLFLLKTAVGFYRTINLLYGVLVEFCNEHTCPIMQAGEKYTYLWKDSDTLVSKYKKATEVSAADYVGLLMNWIEEMLNNDGLLNNSK